MFDVTDKNKQDKVVGTGAAFGGATGGLIGLVSGPLGVAVGAGLGAWLGHQAHKRFGQPAMNQWAEASPRSDKGWAFARDWP